MNHLQNILDSFPGFIELISIRSGIPTVPETRGALRRAYEKEKRNNDRLLSIILGMMIGSSMTTEQIKKTIEELNLQKGE
jgi:hypothetical protein